jgi:hypothetical protein
MDERTPELTKKSIEAVRAQIAVKNSSLPYLANNKAITQSVTDMDHFPYNRYFRGVYYYPDPVIFEREAGWRKRHDNCYDLIIPPSSPLMPNNCFEAACSTVYPCYPQYLQKFADREALNVMLNRACIVQYR